ncbi:MAG: HAMP domain-containing protein [Calditrichaceae bacterium]|nr:HAMP domain-containing protein [Calditrichaceae bacterium]MBN2708879.1 HAMP domain-containing protein [Calditrichaceae bacterium]RQV97595.1 MAG: HAMP domain-containing protein [Calditrichota bacterium]
MLRSLRTKIGLGYITLVLINIAVAVFAIYRIDQLSQPLDSLLKEKYQNVQTAENMLLAISKLDLLQFAMIEKGVDSESLTEFNAYKNEFLNLHQKAIRGIALPDEPVILDSVIIYFNAFIINSNSLHRLIQEINDENSNRKFHHEKIVPYLDKVNKLCGWLRDINEEALFLADTKAQVISGQARQIIIIFSILAVAISILASIVFTRKILKPVLETTETVRKIGRGQFNQKIKIETDDEIALLGMEFNKMTSRLQAYEDMNIKEILLEKKKTETLVDNMPAAILVTDQDNRVYLINDLAREIFEISGDDWQNKNIEDIIKSSILKQFPDPSIINESVALSEKDLIKITRQGSDYYYTLRQIVIHDEAGQIAGKVSLFQDVTSFKKLDRLKSEFMAAVSHELKTPLTSINLAIDIILKEVKGRLNSEQAELLQGVKSDVNRMKQFLLQLLDLTRLESGAYRIINEGINAQELVEEAIDAMQLKTEQKHIIIQKKIGKLLPEFTGDSKQLLRALINLIDNAVKYTNPGGIIKISVVREKDYIAFTVKDKGEGISIEDQKIIFDKFVQVKNFESSESGSIGLGLAICKEIIHAHNGTIGVTSKPGKGSSFKFIIPLQPDNKEKEQ